MGYRVLTFHVQQANDSSGEARDGEGKVNFVFNLGTTQPLYAFRRHSFSTLRSKCSNREECQCMT